MNLHEYQAKQLFRDAGIPVPASIVADSPEAAVEAARQLGGDQWMVKAQIHAGGRGKAGGIKRVESHQQLEEAVSGMLGETLITEQNLPSGQPIQKVLIESPVDGENEYYIGALVDRSCDRVVFIASAEGGMEVEEITEAHPESVYQVSIDPVVGLQPYQCRQLAFKVGLDKNKLRDFCRILRALYRLFVEKDLSMVEINPLILTDDDQLIALDGKINVDDNALARQPELAAMRDPSQENAKEYAAEQHGLNYVALKGNIGCMVNGAGLAMATMDMIHMHGGLAANFLDVGGDTNPERVTEAFKMMVADEHVETILVNVFGGIVHCDVIVEGIIQAARDVNLQMPMVVRLEGTHVEQGREMLAESGLNIEVIDDLSEAAQRAVAMAEGV